MSISIKLSILWRTQHEFIHRLFLEPDDRIVESCDLVKQILSKMEKCADACEHVGDVIETIVMKNT